MKKAGLATPSIHSTTQKPASTIYQVFAELTYYYNHFYWPHFILLFFTPGLAYFRVKYFGITLQPQTACLALILTATYALGVTAGYHRLWTHKAYRASLSLRYFLAVLSCGIFQWSVIWWVRHHRAHHRYVDTEKDPYNIKRGFFYAHVGWLIAYTPHTWGDVDVSDVESDPVARWQQRYYLILHFIVGALIPALIAHFGWGDFRGGFWWAGWIRILINVHMIFCVNSFAHSFGDHSYSSNISARDSWLVALISGGEGYHNFHHRFPSDYRNAPHNSIFDFDYTKRFIYTCEKLGFAKSLIRTPRPEIERVRKQVQTDNFTSEHDQRNHLPLMTSAEFQEQSRSGRHIMRIFDCVCDVTDFIHRHPGGSDTLQNAIGTDATVLFDSSGHPPYAKDLVFSMQIATLKPSPKTK